MNNKRLLQGLLLVLLSGCVSTTTTTSAGRSEPNSADAAQQNFQLGARYYRKGNYELARDRLLKALEFKPKMAIVHYTLGLTYEQLENTRLAKQHYELAVKHEPKNYDARNAYAVFLCRQQEFDAARKQFDKAVGEIENDNAEITLTNAGVCMAGKPDYAAAEQYFRQAIRRKPSYGEALIQMSALQHKTGNDFHARAFLQRYQEIVAASPGALFLGIQIEEKLGDERARAAYAEQLLNDFPDSAEARHVRDSR